MITLNYRDSRPIYEQIKENIIKLIMTHSLEQDEKLPSVRELAVELAINPNTIQRAYYELEKEGYIYKVTGRGTFVAPQREARADVTALLEEYKTCAAKLLFRGVSAAQLKQEIDRIDGEVSDHD